MRLLLPLLLITGLSFGQIVNIPDPNFKAFLVGFSPINTNGDTEIQVSEANTYTGGIYIQSSNVSDLTGIEEFVNIDVLHLPDNQVQTLDLSQNLALITLNCHSNEITSLNITQNVNLIDLDCSSNQLTTLDISNNEALTIVNCGSNDLTSLDVSQNTNTEELICEFNDLSSLDVSNNALLTKLWCGSNFLTNLDVTQNTDLNWLITADNDLTSIDLSQNTNLVSLSARSNELSTIDLSHNSMLEFLDIGLNQLTSVSGLSQTPNLNDFRASKNQLTSLNLSLNPALTLIDVSWNELSCLNLKNGNNTNITFLDAVQNDNLTCIEVDDEIWATNNWMVGDEIETHMFFSENCNNTCLNNLGLEELSYKKKEILKITNMMGQETEYKPNTLQIYIYSDGTSKKVFMVE